MSADPCINSSILNLCARAQVKYSVEACRDTSDLAHTGTGVRASSSGGEASDDRSDRHNDQADVDSTDATHPALPSAKRSPRDYEWLRQAIANVESPERRVKQLLDVMEQKDKTEDVMLDALSELGDLVEDINWAAEFKLMHGPARVLRVLRSSIATADGSDLADVIYAHSSVRAALATVVAHSSQLDDALQQSYAEEKWIDVLVPLLQNENGKRSGQTSVAALLHACSCLCRGSSANTTMFIQKGGLSVLECLLQTRRPESANLARRDDGGVADRSADDHNDKHDLSGRMHDKILARVFFFVAYLGEVGVSTEKLIRLTCEYGSYSATSDVVQRAIARALLQLIRQSPTLVKTEMRSVMPEQLQSWRALRDEHAADGDDEVIDERARLLAEFECHS